MSSFILLSVIVAVAIGASCFAAGGGWLGLEPSSFEPCGGTEP